MVVMYGVKDWKWISNQSNRRRCYTDLVRSECDLVEAAWKQCVKVFFQKLEMKYSGHKDKH